jgi:hypothetical protein
MSAAVDPENRTIGAYPLSEKVQDAAGTASQIDHALAEPYSDLGQLRVGVRGEVGNLLLQPLLFMLVAPKQIDVPLSHGSILPARFEANFGGANGRFMACEVLGYAGYR